MPPRSWMKTIHRFSDAMRCVPWDRTHPLPNMETAVPSSKRMMLRGGGMHHNANRSSAAFVTVANRRCTVK